VIHAFLLCDWHFRKDLILITLSTRAWLTIELGRFVGVHFDDETGYVGMTTDVQLRYWHHTHVVSLLFHVLETVQPQLTLTLA
jgi:hypothetical protein